MKKMAKLVFCLMLIGAMLLTACGGTTEPAAETTKAAAAETTKAAAAETKGEETTAAASGEDHGMLKIAYSGICDSLDPVNCTTSIPCNLCTENFYCALMRRTETHEITYSLADKYEISEDGKTYTFHINQNATFMNGDKITVEDVVYSYQITAASAARQSYWVAIDTIEAVDDETVRFNLKYADPLFLGKCASTGNAAVVKKELYEEYGETYGQDLDHVLGCGPYDVTEWIPNVSITFKYRDTYWGDEPDVKEATLYSITDTNGTIVAIQTGDIDVSFSPVAGSAYDTLSKADGVHFTEYHSGRFENLHFLMKHEVWSDLRMRQAVAYACNNEDALIVGVDGKGKTTRYPGDNGIDAADPNYDSPYAIKYDVEKGKALVKECGNEGLAVEIYSYQPDPYPALSTWLQSALTDIGLDATVNVMERSAFLEACRNEEMPLGILSLVGSSFDLDDDFNNYVSKAAGGFGNRGWYASDKMEELITKERNTVGDDARAEIFKEMIDVMWQDVPLVPLFVWDYALPVRDGIDLPNGRTYGLLTIHYAD